MESDGGELKIGDMDDERKLGDGGQDMKMMESTKKRIDKTQILVDAAIGDVDEIAIMGERHARLTKRM